MLPAYKKTFEGLELPGAQLNNPIDLTNAKRPKQEIKVLVITPTKQYAEASPSTHNQQLNYLLRNTSISKTTYTPSTCQHCGRILKNGSHICPIHKGCQRRRRLVPPPRQLFI